MPGDRRTRRRSSSSSSDSTNSTTRRSQSRSRSRRSRSRSNRSTRREQNSRLGDSAVHGARNYFERLGVDDTAGHGDTQGSNLSQFKRILWDQQETIEELLQEKKNKLCQKIDTKNKHKFSNSFGETTRSQ